MKQYLFWVIGEKTSVDFASGPPEGSIYLTIIYQLHI